MSHRAATRSCHTVSHLPLASPKLFRPTCTSALYPPSHPRPYALRQAYPEGTERSIWPSSSLPASVCLAATRACARRRWRRRRSCRR